MKFSPPEFDLPPKEELVFRMRLSAHAPIICLLLCLVAYVGYLLTSSSEHLIFFALSHVFLVTWLIFFLLCLYLFLVFAVNKVFVSTLRIYGRRFFRLRPMHIALTSIKDVRAYDYFPRLPGCGGAVILVLKNKKKIRFHCVLAPMKTADALKRMIK